MNKCEKQAAMLQQSNIIAPSREEMKNNAASLRSRKKSSEDGSSNNNNPDSYNNNNSSSGSGGGGGGGNDAMEESTDNGQGTAATTRGGRMVPPAARSSSSSSALSSSAAAAVGGGPLEISPDDEYESDEYESDEYRDDDDDDHRRGRGRRRDPPLGLVGIRRSSSGYGNIAGRDAAYARYLRWRRVGVLCVASALSASVLGLAAFVAVRIFGGYPPPVVVVAVPPVYGGARLAPEEYLGVRTSGGGAERVLVTGGLGFIGSHVVELLLHRGFRVTILDDESNGHNRNADATEMVPRDITVVTDFPELPAAAAAGGGG